MKRNEKIAAPELFHIYLEKNEKTCTNNEAVAEQLCILFHQRTQAVTRSSALGETLKITFGFYSAINCPYHIVGNCFSNL